MAKKRTTLDAVLPAPTAKAPRAEGTKAATQQSGETDEGAAKPSRRLPHLKQQTIYLSLAAHKHLKLLAIEEEKKQHDLLLEAVDLLFANRGLPGIDES